VNTETIVVAIGIGAMEVLLKPFQKMIMPVLKKLAEHGFRKNQKGVYERKVAIAALLALIEEQTGVVKAIQVQTKNGGGVPKAGTPIYGSIVAPVKYSDSFRSQLLDGQYCDMLGKLISQKQLTFLTDDLPPCILKSQLRSQKITACMCFDAAITKSDYNFISVDLSISPMDLTDEAKDNIRQYTTDIIKLLNK
jgi:hypothetical protein